MTKQIYGRCEKWKESIVRFGEHLNEHPKYPNCKNWKPERGAPVNRKGRCRDHCRGVLESSGGATPARAFRPRERDCQEVAGGA